MSTSEGRKIQVLLVEDNLTDATLIRAVLERDGTVRVTLAQDGLRGCQLAESQSWDLIVTDLNLPGRDGIQVVKASKAVEPDRPVLAMSAYVGGALREGAFRAGANDILSKPVDPAHLVRTVHDLLQANPAKEQESRRVLAIGTLPGDVESGCGGTLLKHVQAGDEVHILVLGTDGRSEDFLAQREAAVKAGAPFGGRVLLPPKDGPSLPDLDTMVLRVQDARFDLEPHTIYAPSAADVRESRQHAHLAAETTATQVESLLCYQAATTTLEFRPTVFEDISEVLQQKLAVLSHYGPQVHGRPHLDPDMVKATARYWGRFLGYGMVEPFESVQ